MKKVTEEKCWQENELTVRSLTAMVMNASKDLRWRWREREGERDPPGTSVKSRGMDSHTRLELCATLFAWTPGATTSHRPFHHTNLSPPTTYSSIFLRAPASSLFIFAISTRVWQCKGPPIGTICIDDGRNRVVSHSTSMNFLLILIVCFCFIQHWCRNHCSLFVKWIQ